LPNKISIKLLFLTKYFIIKILQYCDKYHVLIITSKQNYVVYEKDNLFINKNFKMKVYISGYAIYELKVTPFELEHIKNKRV